MKVTIIECRCTHCRRFDVALANHVIARRHGQGNRTIRKLRAAAIAVDTFHKFSRDDDEPKPYN